MQGVQTVSDRQTEFLGDGGFGSGVVAGQHGSLLLGGDGSGVQVNEHELLGLAFRALDLGAELQCALVHAGIVGELHVLREVAAVDLVYDSVVLVNFRTLIVFGGAGHFAALEYDDGGNLDDRLLVEVLDGESDIDVGGDDAVVQRENLGGNRQFDIVPVLGHLLEAITARKCQGGSYEHNAQFH